MNASEGCPQCGSEHFEAGEGKRCLSCGFISQAELLSDTDIANSRRFARQHGDNVRFTCERGFLVWDGRRFAPDERGILVQELAKRTALSIFDEVKSAANRDAMFQHARRSQSRKAIDAMLWLARSEPGIPVHLTDFDANGWLFNVSNGTLDLRAGAMLPHRREDLITNLSDIRFDPEASCPMWDAFVSQVTDQNADLVVYLRRFVGYLLVGDTSDQSVHFLYGLGANGKSVFSEVLQALLGDYAVVCSPDLIMLRRHGGIPNDVARLRGVRAALMNETSQGSRFDEAKLKDLTGSDTLTARFLHKEFFDFPPTHRIIIRGNHKPAIAGTDEGIWRRLRLVPFSVEIPPGQQDHDLLRKLKSELPGILNWALAGCLEWQRDGLRPPAVITDAVRQYRAESDTLGRFIAEHCQASTLSRIKSSEFYGSYLKYAQLAGERAVTAKELPSEMQRRGFEWKRTNLGGVYVGIELTPCGHANGSVQR